MDFLKIATTLAGIAMSFGFFPQAYKIWRLRSAKEISLLNYVILGGGHLIWMFYGIAIHDAVLWVTFSFGLIGIALVLFLTMHFRNKI